MSEAEIRLSCIELALTSNLQRESAVVRASAFADFVQNDPLRLKAVQLATKQEGSLARIGSDRIIETAKGFLAFANLKSPQPEDPAQRRRGRPKRS